MKILMADDDVFFRKFYSSKLKAEGFEVDVVANGQEVLTYLTKARPNLLLLDLIMPGIDGFEVLKRISENPQTKGLPIIVFSTLSQQQDVERAKSLGANDFVNKSSLNFSSLVEKIRSFDAKQNI